MLRNSPEAHGTHLPRGGSLKSRGLHKAVLKPMATKGTSCLQERRSLYINIQWKLLSKEKNILHFPLSLSSLLLKAHIVMGCVF